MGIKDAAINGNDSVARYAAYRDLGWMICPEYRQMPVSARSTSDGDAGAGQGLAYCVSLAFLDRAWESFAAGAQPSQRPDLNGNLIVALSGNGKPIIQLPISYGPRITKISNGSTKVWAADGGRTVIPVGGVEKPPVYTISGDPSKTGWDATSFADVGAFGGWSHSCYRTAVPGNATNTPAQDVRVWSLRHGTLGGFKSTGSYRMNVVFFDGHGETLDETAASNPALWMPKGSVIFPFVGASGNAVAGTKTVWSDVRPRYCPGVTSNAQSWTAP
jgi:prepilin-type processing-associated H-X9-DG protein